MGKEIDLLAKYPKTKRDLTKRLESKSEEVRSVARKFGKEFFDGDREQGYGGYNYNEKFWVNVVKDFIDYWVICDTGSTDDTKSIINSELSGISGELHEVEWVSFGHNRTALLKLCKGKADYLLLIDAPLYFPNLIFAYFLYLISHGF